ncbi:MAG: glycosyltransferase family 9 protein [Acidimicrobiales bacterium]
MLSRILVARMDSLGDVLLSGPLVRACAAGSSAVSFLCSPTGADAASLLPGVDQVVVARAGWIESSAPEVDRNSVDDLVDRIAGVGADRAVISTSFHQSPLPLALILRMAGVAHVGAISVDFPGSLLDVRHRVDEDVHEVERSLSLGAAMGYRLPAGDDGALRVTLPDAVASRRPDGPYVVVHPGASVPARAWRWERHAALVEQLSRDGRTVVVTGGPQEVELTAAVAGGIATDLGGELDLAELAAVIGDAEAIVVGNTGPAHLAAAVGTPVVSLFAPTVPALRWKPWMVPNVLLGRQGIPCAGCRARLCPVEGHPCIDGLAVSTVVDAVDHLARTAAAPWGRVAAP